MFKTEILFLCRIWIFTENFINHWKNWQLYHLLNWGPSTPYLIKSFSVGSSQRCPLVSFRLYQFKECSPQINRQTENQMSVVRVENPIKMEVRGRERVNQRWSEHGLGSWNQKSVPHWQICEENKVIGPFIKCFETLKPYGTQGDFNLHKILGRVKLLNVELKSSRTILENTWKHLH